MTLMRFSLSVALAATLWSADTGYNLFQKGLAKERAESDPRAAIKIYAQVVHHHATDRKLAAQALIRLAECYEKLGDAEARKAYEQIVRDYADQKDAVALANVRLGWNPQQPSSEPNKLVWRDPKLGLTGRVSADGRYLSFTDWRSGDLMVREIATGINHRLTTENYQAGKPQVSGSEVEASAISRDGKQVVYTWFGWDDKSRRTELRLASMNSSPNPRRLYHNPEFQWYKPWDWSPDGKWISVEIWHPDRTRQIGIISVPDGSLRVLKSVDWRGANGLFFSPDGKYLAYDLAQSDDGPQRDIFLLSSMRPTT